MYGVKPPRVRAARKTCLCRPNVRPMPSDNNMACAGKIGSPNAKKCAKSAKAAKRRGTAPGCGLFFCGMGGSAMCAAVRTRPRNAINSIYYLSVVNFHSLASRCVSNGRPARATNSCHTHCATKKITRSRVARHGPSLFSLGVLGAFLPLICR